jgi:hypothetical protein
MAYFAKLGTGNIVEQVISINNAVITDANGVEQEQLGNDFINKLYNTRDVWKQTSYNNNFRKNYAGIGFYYDQVRDAFIAPKPYNSWILNEDTCRWEAPVAKPTEELEDNQYYSWNESIINWEVKQENNV